MAPSFEDLVTLQRTADKAHCRVQQLFDDYGRSPVNEWTEYQRTTWRTAWKSWVDDVCGLQEAIKAYTFEQGREIRQVDADVKKAARQPGTAT
ncbi:hypothetical protein [Streptomyces paradoxus]|uniref:Uncharacterized protein n=1 Tax=Streptomyces paradoxus TaxID=66375 RepID=A0A7W9WLB4_9ACTN|nr:hypothetical protein [Streptomyces paradoxus]MBB6081184.1 hypothetical protein [Streptomyces paradoxus]